MIPQELKEQYPFTPKTISSKSGHTQSYVDEGEGEVLVMLHGNPTWSFYYRNLIKKFSKNYRVIVPDHIGCGLSEKPQDWSYRLKDHIDNVEHLLDTIGIKDFSLVVHDWGGAIGFGVATRNPKRVKKACVLNTAAFTCDFIPWQINLVKTPLLGDNFIRRFNGFAGPAVFMSVKKPLSSVVKKGFLLPYNNYENRIATSRFVQDIPMNNKHPSWNTLFEIESKLKDIKFPIKLFWGEKDFCFHMKFFKRWKSFFPKSEDIVYPKAGHYVLEDAHGEIENDIEAFLRG